MNALPRISFAVVLVVSTILFSTPRFSAETDSKIPQPVKVVNTTKNPVPTVAQGTTKISGNVKVTNSLLPVTGSVSITNSNLPVSVTNTPLPVMGTVSVAPDTTQYQYASIVAISCVPTQNGPWDFCLYTENGATTPMEQVLTTYSSQGYELFSITGVSVNVQPEVLYTLRAPVAGGHKKASQTRR
jgi:hypothetical protein